MPHVLCEYSRPEHLGQTSTASADLDRDGRRRRRARGALLLIEAVPPSWPRARDARHRLVMNEARRGCTGTHISRARVERPRRRGHSAGRRGGAGERCSLAVAALAARRGRCRGGPGWPSCRRSGWRPRSRPRRPPRRQPRAADRAAAAPAAPAAATAAPPKSDADAELARAWTLRLFAGHYEQLAAEAEAVPLDVDRRARSGVRAAAVRRDLRGRG